MINRWVQIFLQKNLYPIILKMAMARCIYIRYYWFQLCEQYSTSSAPAAEVWDQCRQKTCATEWYSSRIRAVVNLTDWPSSQHFCSVYCALHQFFLLFAAFHCFFLTCCEVSTWVHYLSILAGQVLHSSDIQYRDLISNVSSEYFSFHFRCRWLCWINHRTKLFIYHSNTVYRFPSASIAVSLLR